MSVPSFSYSSTRRKRPHWACRIFLNPRTGPGTRCDFGQNGQTKRVPIAFGVRSTITDHPALHSLYSIGSRGTAACFLTTTATFTAALAAGLEATRFATRLLDRFAPLRTADRRPAVRLVRVARIASALHSQYHCAANVLPQLLKNSCRYFRRSTMCLSVRLLLRVFLPNVGKAHGVTGWLPFTRPSPPPCG